MELKEIQREVDELEPRLERLRALYEQYFMGLEKIEPATVRRAVDRKFWQLRKLRIQNTALRFRLQMLIQRYNTYQQYWARVMREMERGTYRRDVLRAAKRVGSSEAMTILGKRRVQMFQKLAEAQEERQSRVVSLAEEQEQALQAAVAEMEAGGDAAQVAAQEPAAWESGGEDDEDDDTPTVPPPPQPAQDDDTPTVPPAPAAAGDSAGFIDPTQWNLLDDDDLGGSPTAAEPQAAAAPPPAEEPTGPAQAEDSTAGLREFAPPRKAPMAPGPPAADEDDDDAPTVPPAPTEAAHRVGAQLQVPPSSPPDTAADEAGTAPIPPPLRNRPSPPPERPNPPPQAPTASTEDTEERPRPLPPAKRPRPPARPSSKSTSPAGEPVAPIRKLYDAYVEAKRRSKEPTDGLTYDKMARSLQRQTERLRKKHGNRKIDYEVVTKDGRTLIRPKIR